MTHFVELDVSVKATSMCIVHLHRAALGKANHLVQKIGGRVYFTSARGVIMSSIIGGLSRKVGFDNQTLPESADDRRLGTSSAAS